MSFYAPQDEIKMVELAIGIAKKILPFYENYYNASYPLPKSGNVTHCFKRIYYKTTTRRLKTHHQPTTDATR